MKIANAHLKSTTPYSQSRPMIERRPDEGPNAYDICHWRGHMHVNEDGYVFIPSVQFQQAVIACASRGVLKGSKVRPKDIESGVITLDPLVLSVKAEDVIAERLIHPTGVPCRCGGCGRRFPVIPKWEGNVQFLVDDTISEEIFMRCLREAGSFVGIGRWRVERRGMYGRFAVEKIEWQLLSDVDFRKMFCAPLVKATQHYAPLRSVP